MSPRDPSDYDWREHRADWSQAIALVVIIILVALVSIAVRSL